MGCVSSSSGKEGRNDVDKSQADEYAPEGAESADGPQTSEAGSKPNKKNTRARRLSYVTADANGKAEGQAAPTTATPASAEAGGKGPQAASGARARRLSYVTNDPNAGPPPPILAGGGEEEYADEVTAGVRSVPVQTPTAGGSSSGDALAISVACMSRAGREPGFKKTNQDNCFAFEKYITENQSLFGAMDGHGPHGHLVSSFVKQNLPIILVNHLTAERDPSKALSSGFVEVDRTLTNSRIDCEFSGSTCVVAYLKGSTLTTAWVGDSRGVIAREGPNGLEALDLTVDHKPTDPEEMNRILRSNGRVERLVDEVGQPMGPHRVWLQYAWIPGLAMSRAIGDVLAHQVGVISEPQHSVTEVTPQDRFMILASDGVWEFISSQEAVDIVAKYESTEEACCQLVDEAYQRWLTEEEGVVDDVTAVIVRFLQ